MIKQAKNKVSRYLSLEVVHPNAAGIDIGSRLMSVAVPAGRDRECVKEFGSFTCDLYAIADWLKQCDVDTVAMECTGVYWKNLFLVLTEYGFEVCLANARHTRNVSGKKTDESDAVWIQRLHSCGLLSSSFLPDDQTSSLRSLVRHRRSLTQDSSRYILRMKKALEMMNIKFHSLIRDLTGKTGTAIVEAILAGERDPENLLKLVNFRVKASKDDLRKSLQGNWRQEQLFLLAQCYKMHQFTEQQISICDSRVETVLQAMEASRNEGVIEQTAPPKIKAKPKKHPQFNTRSYLQKIHAVDVLAIYGISDIAAIEILSETGTDLSKWPTEKHFVSWLNLCPNNKISGGKLISSAVLKKKPNGATQAFKFAANGVQRSQHWLGDYFRRMKAKGGNKYAIVATARKLAIIYYKMIRYHQNFIPFDNQEYKSKFQRTKIAYLERILIKLKGETFSVI
jgi:transposase